jgi:hypothetical protein
LVFGNTVGAIGRRGLDRNVVIDGNTFDVNVQADAANLTWHRLRRCNLANIHFCNSGTIEQVAILNNTILPRGYANGPASRSGRHPVRPGHHRDPGHAD